MHQTPARLTPPRAALVAITLAVAGALVSAQTAVEPPANKYPPSEDVKLGEQAATEVQQQLPILHDDLVTSYVRGIGERLVAAIPPSLRHPEFHYTFEVVDVSDINAFALPGGPMFVNRGMLAAAGDEGEIAGVMAHELSHVVLRHGTAQASKATKYEVGQLAGAVIGSIVGGVWGNVISQGTQFGLGAAFLRFSREFEKQADIEGSHIMARAGYDPRAMANMFRTIEQKSGPGGPEWLSDHPNPGNRYEYITEEAQSLHVSNPIDDHAAFQRVEAHLETLPPAPTTEQATQAAGAQGARGTSGTADRQPQGRVEPPSGSFRTYTEGRTFRVAVPSNWHELPGGNAVTFAPEGAYGQSNGQRIFTHGVEIGVARNETHDLQTATRELLSSLAGGNPRLQRTSQPAPTTVGNRRGLRTRLSNVSAATGQTERIELYTTLLPDGNLLYAIAVAPESAFSTYARAFDRVVSSLQLI